MNELVVDQAPLLDVPTPDSDRQYSPQHVDMLGSMAALVTSDPLSITPTEDRIAQFSNDTELASNYATPDQEQILRDMASLQRAQKSVGSLRGLVAEASLGSDYDMLKEATANYVAGQSLLVDKFALEKETLDKLETYGLMDKDGLILANMSQDKATALDDLRDTVERSFIVQNALAGIQSEFKEQSTPMKVLQYLSMIIPFTEVTTLSHLSKDLLSPTSGTMLRTLENNIYNSNLSNQELEVGVENIVKTLRDSSGWIGENLAVLQHLVSGMNSMGEHESDVRSAFDWIDLAALAPFAGAVKLSKAGLANISRARELSKTVTIQEYNKAAAGGKVGDIDEVIEAMMPDAVRGTQSDLGGVAGVSEEVNRILAEQNKLKFDVERVLNDTVSARTAEETETLLLDMQGSLDKAYSGVYVKNVKIDPDNAQVARVLLGKKEGGFATESSAKTARTKAGLQGHSIHTDPDGRFYIDVKFGIKDGSYLLLENPTSSPSWLRNFAASSAQFLDNTLHGKAIQANLIESGLHKALNTMLKTGWKPLKKGEQTAVRAILEKGNEAGVWYTPGQFVEKYTTMHNGRMPNQREFMGYYTAKNINDFDYHLRNNVLYKELLRDGWETGGVSFEGLTRKGNIKIRQEPIENFRGMFYDPELKQSFTNREISYEQMKARMSSENKVLVELDEYVTLGGQPTNMILMNRSAVERGPLGLRQLDYSPGGHRIYDGDFWVKQVRIGNYKGSDRKFVLSPLTHIVAKTRSEAAAWAKKMEGTRLSYLEMKGRKIDRAEWELRATELGVDPQEFEKWAKNGDVDIRNPFEVVTSEQNIPTGHTKTLMDDGTVDLSQVRSPQKSFLQDTGRLYYGKKGEVKRGPQDEVAKLIDPMESINRGVENAIRLSSYAEYKQRAVNGWLNMYGDLLPKNPNSAGMARFWNDVDLRKVQGDPVRINNAVASRDAIMRQLKRGNEYMRQWKGAMRTVGGWFEDKAPGISRKLYDAESFDPVTALKGMAFDLKLGLGDPSQLLVQTQTIAAMAFLDPTNAAKFVYEGFWLRALAHNHSEEFLNFAAKRSGMEVDEFKSMFHTMNEVGATNVGGELILQDHHAVIMKGPLGDVLDTARNVGRFPFYEAERLNRIYAFRKTWNDLRKGHEVPWFGTPDGRAETSRLVDKYTNNMMTASAASWQKGFPALGTQFLSYQARMMENVLPVMFGGNKQFTSGEKMRLFLSQAALYGAAGVPFGEYAMRKLTENGVIDKNDVGEVGYRALAGGFWDSMLYAVTGGELDLSPSQRLSPAKGIEQFVMDVFGQNEFEDASVAKMIMGAGGSVARDLGSDAISVLYDVMMAASSEKVDLISTAPDMLLQLADNASGFSRMHKAYIAWRYGDLISLNTGRTLTKVTPMETFAVALGIQTRDMVDMGWMRTMLLNDEAEIKKIRTQLSKHRQRYVRAFREDDRAEMTRQLEIINGHLALYPHEVQAKVLSGIVANKDLKPLVDATREKFGRLFNPNIFPTPNTER